MSVEICEAFDGEVIPNGKLAQFPNRIMIPNLVPFGFFDMITEASIIVECLIHPLS